MNIEFKGMKPSVSDKAFIAEGVKLIGNVKIEEDAGIWYNAVLRADINEIRVGKRSNVQDGCAVHVDHTHPTIIGDDVTIGHNAVIHGCEIGDNALIGMGAIVLNGAVVGEKSLVGAGALIGEGKVVPPRSLVVGNPMRVIRELNDEQLKAIEANKDTYVKLAQDFLAE
jgi:carbonic anhydrase/acetyltransferase-like protein (isoleucine patch superfamily)